MTACLLRLERELRAALCEICASEGEVTVGIEVLCDEIVSAVVVVFAVSVEPRLRDVVCEDEEDETEDVRVDDEAGVVVEFVTTRAVVDAADLEKVVAEGRADVAGFEDADFVPSNSFLCQQPHTNECCCVPVSKKERAKQKERSVWVVDSCIHVSKRTVGRVWSLIEADVDDYRSFKGSNYFAQGARRNPLTRSLLT